MSVEILKLVFKRCVNEEKNTLLNDDVALLVNYYKLLGLLNEVNASGVVDKNSQDFIESVKFYLKDNKKKIDVIQSSSIFNKIHKDLDNESKEIKDNNEFFNLPVNDPIVSKSEFCKETLDAENNNDERIRFAKLNNDDSIYPDVVNEINKITLSISDSCNKITGMLMNDSKAMKQVKDLQYDNMLISEQTESRTKAIE